MATLLNSSLPISLDLVLLVSVHRRGSVACCCSCADVMAIQVPRAYGAVASRASSTDLPSALLIKIDSEECTFGEVSFRIH